jgi:hypothetical protein
VTVGRNDPCPCGSGRKYKRCCQVADREAEATAGSTPGVLPFRRGRRGLPRGVRQAASSEASWEADVIPLMVLIEEEADQRPVLVLVTAGEVIVHHDLRPRLGGEAEDVARALDRAVTAAASAVGLLPAVVRVRHADVAEALAPLLERRDVVVEAGPTPMLEDAGRSALEEMTGYGNWPPPCRTETWGAWDLPRALVARVFQATAAFHGRNPWRVATNLQAPRAVLPSGREWTCCVLGNGGQEYGLALYSEADDLFGLLDEEDPGAPFEGATGRIVSVLLESRRDAGEAAIAEARRNGWEVAGPSAWPTLVTVNTPGGGASRADIEDLVTLLEAVPRFVNSHRQALLDEDRTGRPLDPLEWRDPDTGVAFHYAGEGYGEDEADGSTFGLLPDDLREQLGEIFRQVTEELGDADEDAIMDAVNARLRESMTSHNDRPQVELGGLSPARTRRLLESDWEADESAVRIRSDLSLEELAGAEVLANARTFLGLAIDRGGLGATQKGNLKVEVVKTLVERWQSDDDLFHFITERGTRLIEDDVDPVHRLRVVLKLAGLLRKRGPRFEPTRKGRELAAPEGAGELYALLFRTWFRKFNLAYDRVTAWPELQQQVAFTLYRLPRVAHDWRSPDQLLPQVVLPFALDRAPADEPYLGGRAEGVLAHQLLDPLVGFGMLERRREPEHGISRDGWFRVTPLLTRAVQISP